MKFKIHLFFISLIAVLALVFLHQWLPPYNFPWGEHLASYYPRAEILKQSIEQYGDYLPLWNPYTMSGTTYIGKADVVYIGSLLYLFVLFLPAVLAVKYYFITLFFLAGLTMYLLLVSLKLKPQYAFIGALVYMFNGFIIKIYNWGWMTTLGAYVFTPLVLLFTVRAYEEKKWIFNACMAGFFCALQIYAGPDLKVFLFSGIMIGIYFLIQVGSYFVRREKKKIYVIAVYIPIVILLITLGLALPKIIPEKDYIDMSSRQHNTWEESSKRSLKWKDAFSRLIEPIYDGMPKVHRNLDKPSEQIGIVALFLGLFALIAKRKEKMFMWFCVSLMIFAVLFATAGFVFYFLWKYVPPFDSFRYADRALILWVLGGSVLAGIGASELCERIKGIGSKRVMACLLMVLVFINLGIFGVNTIWIGSKIQDVRDAFKNNALLNNVSKEEGMFRMHVFETTGIDWGTELFDIPFGLEIIYGYEGAWIVDYMNIYLGFAYEDPAKYWGMLNVKYVTSQKELNITGFNLVGKFPPCSTCYNEMITMQKAWGPYLYENSKFLPRAFTVDKAILLVGPEDFNKQTMYRIIFPEMDPKKQVIIMGPEKISDYNLDELKKFDAIILGPDTITQADAPMLFEYNKEGVLFPDIFNNDTEQQKDLERFWLRLESNETYKDAEYLMINFDKRKIVAKKGWLVLSELFSLYKDWNAGDLKIYKANGVLSAIYVPEEREINLIYDPSGVYAGFFFVIVTLLVILLAFCKYMLWRWKDA